MEPAATIIRLFDAALATNDFSEYYRELVDLTPEQFTIFENDWKIAAAGDESFTATPRYQKIYAEMARKTRGRGKYFDARLGFIYYGGSTNKHEVINKIFAEHAYPLSERHQLCQWELANLGEPYIDYMYEYEPNSARVFSRLSLMFALRKNISLSEARRRVAHKTQMHLTDEA